MSAIPVHVGLRRPGRTQAALRAGPGKLSAAAIQGGAMLWRVDIASPTEVVSRLTALRREHRDLDAEIGHRAAGLQADELTLKRLKKRKLWLKDCIARLESALIPDEPA